MPKITLLTYATGSFKLVQSALAASALRAGFDDAINMSDEDIKASSFWLRNVETLRCARGAGFWLWKPYIILESVKRARPDEVIFYTDAGRDDYYHFDIRPERFAQLAIESRNGFVLGPLIPQHGPLRRWTKRDCLAILDPASAVCDKPLVQGSPSAWLKTSRSIEFLEGWLEACEDPRCLTDLPNGCGLPEFHDFVDHRHDQSILSVLAHLKGAEFIDLSATKGGRGLYSLMEAFPRSEATHMLLKRPDNIERILRGTSGIMLFLKLLIKRKLKQFTLRTTQTTHA